MKRPKCPKCGHAELNIHELWQRTLSWSLTEIWGFEHSQWPEGFGDNGGEILGVAAECDKCGHWWRLKGIKQVTELKP